MCRVASAKVEGEGTWFTVELREAVEVVAVGGGMYMDAESAESDTMIMVNKSVLRIDQTDLERAFVSGAIKDNLC